MRPRAHTTIVAALTLLTISELHGQCVASDPSINVSSAASIGLTSSDTSLSSSINGAAHIWNNCGSIGIPTINGNASGSVNVEIFHVSGQSTRSDGACGQGRPTVNPSTGQVTGGSITIWDSWGPGGTTPAGTDCTGSFGGLIAHELGHVFGLLNSSCSFYIMGGGWSYMSTPNSQECDQVNLKWQTPPETTGGGGGCEGGTVLNPGEDCSPILVNLSAGHYELTGADDPVSFDIAASGFPARITWTAASSDEAFLWLDRDHNGMVDSGAELFGNATSMKNGMRAPNGFEALRELDTNGDGLIDERDLSWHDLLLWRDLNHDGISQSNEIEPAAGPVVSISLDYHWSGRQDVHGNMFRYESTIRLRTNHGSGIVFETKPLYDIYFTVVP